MRLQIDSALLEAVVTGTIVGMEMTGVVPCPIGASRMVSSMHPYSVIVGLVGASSGTVTLSFSERLMSFLVGQLMGTTEGEIDETTIDGIMELGNMVAGCIKEQLEGSEYEVSRISLPSLIVGPAHSVIYARGIKTVSAQFEVEQCADLRNFSQHIFSTSMSLLRASGS